jgi:ADP-heptose:LPS heptosyltransferase
MQKKSIIIAPYAQKLRNNKNNAKNFPYWKELIALLEPDFKITQIGVNGEEILTRNVKFNLPLDELKALISKCDFWISVDSFLPHLAYHLKKKGVVIWSVSDPFIFGYQENLNLIKDRRYLRSNQFDIWECIDFSEEPFFSAQEVYDKILKFIYQ